MTDIKIPSKRWKKSNTSVFDLGYHLIWCPKYRRKVLVDGKDLRLKRIFLEKASSMGWEIKTMEVMSDHVHLFIKADPTASPHWIVQQLKGHSSRVMREEFPDLKSKLPTLWTRSYFCSSVGHISESSVKKYIEQQKGK